MVTLCLVMVIVLSGLAVPLALAQGPSPEIDLPRSLVDAVSGLSLRYPADWYLSRRAASSLILATDHYAAMGVRALEPGHASLEFTVIEGSADSAAAYLSCYLETALGGTDADLSIPPTPITLGEWPAAFRLIAWDEVTTVTYVLALGDGQFLVATLTLYPPDLDAYQPIAEAILATVALAPGDNALDVDLAGLPNTSSTADGAYTFSYPDGWGLDANDVARLDYPADDPMVGTLMPDQAVIRVRVLEPVTLPWPVTIDALALAAMNADADYTTGTLNGRAMASWEISNGGWHDAWYGVAVDLGGGAYGEVTLFTMGGQVRGFAQTAAQIAASLRPALTQTCADDDGILALDYPAGWLCVDSGYAMMLLNDRDDAIPPEPGNVAIFLFTYAPDDPEELPADAIDDPSAVAFELDGRPAVRWESFEEGSAVPHLTVLLEKGTFAEIIVINHPDEMGLHDPVVLDIAASIRLTD